MPIYEYRCEGCRKRTSVFTRSVSAAVTAVCDHCGSKKMTRLFSRVSVRRSGDDFGGLDESSLAGLDENDPKSMAKWIRRMSEQMGEPLDAEMEGDLERLEAGEMPDDDAGDGTANDDLAGVD